MSALFIIAACSMRKRLPVPPRRCLRAIMGRSINLRAIAWRSVLQESTERGVTAGDLYAGGYWSVVRDLPILAERAGFRPEFFVASAGYGLVPANRPVLGYSATFTAGHPDSVLYRSVTTVSRCRRPDRNGGSTSTGRTVRYRPRHFRSQHLPHRTFTRLFWSLRLHRTWMRCRRTFAARQSL